MSDFVKQVDSLPKYKGRLKIVKRRVPRWARPFQRFGLFKKIGDIISVREYKNVFVNSGRQSIMDRFTGANTGEITYLELGNGTATPSVTDTSLGNGLYRKKITSRKREGLKFYSSTFIPSTEGNYTYKEIGLFGDDATSTLGSGTLYTRALINETKTAAESLTIDYDIDGSA